MNIDLDEVRKLYQGCIDKISANILEEIDGALPNSILDEFVGYVCQYPITQKEQLIALEKRLGDKFGADVRVLYNQALIFRLYIDKIGKIDEQNIPKSIVTLLKEDFSRAFRLATNNNVKYLTFNSQLYLSYIEKICFKSFPAGVEDLTLSGIPRSLIFKQDFVGGIRLAWLMLRMRGFYPMFELHYNPHRLRLFNEKGWDATLRRAVEMLAVREDVKGLFGAAWWFDPSLEDISPEITYMQKICKRIGGDIYYFRSTEADIKNALMTSKTRREAYKEGKYTPTSYMMVLPKDVLFAHYKL